jgi:hypothetical protein
VIEAHNRTGLRVAMLIMKCFVLIFEKSSSGKPIIRQHLAVTLPWAQAKLALFWLRWQIEVMEAQSGKISIRPDLLPQEPPDPGKDDPAAKMFYDLYRRLRAEFIASV